MYARISGGVAPFKIQKIQNSGVRLWLRRRMPRRGAEACPEGPARFQGLKLRLQPPS